MIKILIILITSAVPLTIFGQRTGMYNPNRTLKADTTLAIEKEAFENWLKYEDYVLWRISQNFNYTDIARDSKLDGFSIIKISVDQNGKASYDKISLIGGGLEEEIIRLLEKYEIPELLKSKDSLDFVYYLPLQFQFIDLKTLADSTGKLFLMGPEYPRIQK